MHGPGGIRTHNLQVRHTGALSIELQDHQRKIENEGLPQILVLITCGYLRATLSSRHAGAPKSYSKKDPQVTAGLFLCFYFKSSVTSFYRATPPLTTTPR